MNKFNILEDDELSPDMLTMDSFRNESLSPLKRKMLKKKAIKLTMRAHNVSNSKATKIVNKNETWSYINNRLAEAADICAGVARSIQEFNELDYAKLKEVELEVKDLCSFTNDLKYVLDKISRLDYRNKIGEVKTSEDFAKYNAAIAEVDDINNSMIKLIIPIQTQLMVAAALLNKGDKNVK